MELAMAGSCIMRVWHHGSALGPCKCPICRRLITLLIPTETAQSQRHEPVASQILENIEKYNRSFGGGSHSIMQIEVLFLTTDFMVKLSNKVV
ncbi:hypothetical protein IEQ34_005283 [Dendrobium chrysotoxum]|uniref:Uncharacterized protein n=1 Tax=Dendrobium chrysotoxum TaxID=161865 RepID=A0AAV7GTI4_DENCH|nr:hypothetical protein IEQ34_005283 [Dendrobium chrysotoxum]